MSGLVGYGSSDDEGDHVQPGEAPRPAKVGDCYMTAN